MILALLLVGLMTWTLIMPTVSSASAASTALAFKGGPGAGWHVTSVTMATDGNRPPQARDPISKEPKCWGLELPWSTGCFPYPMWWVYLSLPTGVCAEDVVLVDGRKGTVAGGWRANVVCLPTT